MIPRIGEVAEIESRFVHIQENVRLHEDGPAGDYQVHARFSNVAHKSDYVEVRCYDPDSDFQSSAGPGFAAAWALRVFCPGAGVLRVHASAHGADVFPRAELIRLETPTRDLTGAEFGFTVPDVLFWPLHTPYLWIPRKGVYCVGIRLVGWRQASAPAASQAPTGHIAIRAITDHNDAPFTPGALRFYVSANDFWRDGVSSTSRITRASIPSRTKWYQVYIQQPAGDSGVPAGDDGIDAVLPRNFRLFIGARYFSGRQVSGELYDVP